MIGRSAFLFLALVKLSLTGVGAVQVRNRVNPIRRVVNLLQEMAKKIAEEGEQEAALYKNFECYCRTTSQELQTSAEEGTARITESTSKIQAGESVLLELKTVIKVSQVSREEAKQALASAGALDDKGASAFDAESSDLAANIDALTRAIAALEKGVSGSSFLQSHIGSAIRKVAMSSEKVSDSDRSTLLSFLSSGDRQGYAPQSGEIIGILKQLKDEMSADLAAAQKEEEDRKANHAGLIAAKKEEIATLTATIETKLTRQGNLAVEVESLKNDVADTQRSLAADQELAAKLAESCRSQSSEWEERQKSRAEELVAIHDTIKLLNDDDALELFKATLPSPSLMQVERGTAALAKRALVELRRSPRAPQNSASNLKLIALALSGKSVDFTKVISMIEEMVALLKAEQGDDDSKKAYCLENFDKTEDDAKALAKTIGGHKDAIQEYQDQLSNTADRIAVVQKSIAELDDSVAKATEIRQKQHAEFVTLTANNAAATELLKLAINRLNKFYAPKLHKAAPKAELSADDRIYVNMGGEITTAAPTGIAGTNVARVQLLQADPVSEPFSSKLEKNHEGYSGVVSLIGSLVADLAKESQEAKVEEDHSQQEYEAFMAESAASRDQKVKEIEELKDTRAAVSASLVQSNEELASAVTSASETAKVISALHQSCDWLLQNFDTRKTARAGEIEALNNAKAVLAGADYSL